jgi:hypothetical protein
MQNIIRKQIALAITLAFAGAAQAAVVLDQNAPTDNAYMAGFGQADLAQSFKQSTTNIAGAGIHLWSGSGGTGEITISLFDQLPNNGGHLLASATGAGVAGDWLDVFWSPVSIAADTTYFLVFTSTNSSMGINGDVNNGYSGGQVYANSGYGGFANYDYTFRTYSDNALGSTVPEPASMALVGLGLGAAMLGRRRKA